MIQFEMWIKYNDFFYLIFYQILQYINKDVEVLYNWLMKLI